MKLFLLNYLPFQNEKNAKITRYYSNFFVASYSGDDSIRHVVRSEPRQVSKKCGDRHTKLNVLLVHFYLCMWIQEKKIIPC